MGQHLTVLDGASDEQQLDWERAGFEQIARGRVAAVLIATTAVDSHALNPRGEDMPIEVEDGTPRVAVPVIGLPSGKSTLQLLAERILKVQQLAASETFGRNAPVTRHVQWYVLEHACCHTTSVHPPVLFDTNLLFIVRWSGETTASFCANQPVIAVTTFTRSCS